MYGRYLSILTIVTRLAASTLIVPAALVAGMLTFPTTCQCNADHQHAHPLFGIAGHRHGDQRAPAQARDTEVIQAGSDGVTVQTPTGSASHALTAIPTQATRLHNLPRASLPIETVLIPDGMSATPDVPPPRA